VIVLAYALVGWWAVSPWLSLAIGLHEGHPFLGWCCGLVPLIGPLLAYWLLRNRLAAEQARLTRITARPR
jgi:hypothetical protein